jgi:hypothetical protein
MRFLIPHAFFLAKCAFEPKAENCLLSQSTKPEDDKVRIVKTED